MTERRGLVLCYYDGEKGEIIPSKAAQSFQNKEWSAGADFLKHSAFAEKKCKSRVFFGQVKDYSAVAVVFVGKQNAGYNELEEVDEGRENVRGGVAAGVKQLQDAGIQSIEVDPCGDAEAAAEGAFLGTYYFDLYKKEKKPAPKMSCYNIENSEMYIYLFFFFFSVLHYMQSCTSYCMEITHRSILYFVFHISISAAWARGVILAEGQNFARILMETPANLMTPTRMGEIAKEKVGCLENVKVEVRDRAWIEEKKMFTFLSVANGSDEPPKLVELHYNGASDDSAPLAFVGKGITFDSGGISLKPALNMDAMRADMGGAACVMASIYTAARLKLPINVKGFLACTENMPSGKATKPGDVVTSMSGKTVQIDNTDAEGRLVMSDTLTYAQTFTPSTIIDMATLTGAIIVALGSCATGVFTNSSYLWENMHKAGTITGDRVWRMPLFKHFSNIVKESSPTADINNIGGGGKGGACYAAAFLKEFVTHERWIHMDIAGVMKTDNEVPYLPKGMAGRPTRTVVEFMNIISKK